MFQFHEKKSNYCFVFLYIVGSDNKAVLSVALDRRNKDYFARDAGCLGKEHALKKYDQFALNTSCFWGSTGSNITLVVQFHGIFVTKIMIELFYYYCC